MLSFSQKTISSKIKCNSVALHSGINVNMTLLPAPNNAGIIFRRIDFAPQKNEIKANYLNVTTTNLGTTIANDFGTKISTIEHLMAAIWGCGIDNLIIELDGSEVPIMDGSSEPFVFLIECAGIKSLEESRKFIEIIKDFRCEEGDKFIEVSPSKQFELDMKIDFNNPNITKNHLAYRSTIHSFKNDICRARTFCFKSEIDQMHQAGLAKGGSLDNAIVIGEQGIINQEALRYQDEFIKHKTLDLLGDLFLSGYFIIGKFNAFKTGHGINNKFLHQLFANKDCWKLT
jgi:UDP-3-O-[3-hydroxymyristoyl] N-acetylglucosamine deacetylase